MRWVVVEEYEGGEEGRVRSSELGESYHAEIRVLVISR